MSIDQRFLIAIAIMALIAFGCRVCGLIVGTYFENNQRVRRIFDILPACAIGAVLGPSVAILTLPEVVALITAVGIYLVSSRFLLALMLGTAVLLSGQWAQGFIY